MILLMQQLVLAVQSDTKMAPELLVVFYPMLLELFKSVSGCMSDSPKVVYFQRIQHGYGIESEESMQLRFFQVRRWGSFCSLQHFNRCIAHSFYPYARWPYSVSIQQTLIIASRFKVENSSY